MSPERVTVKTPATSANLGGGFDCLGIALGLYNTVTAELSDMLEIISDVAAPTDETNLVYRAARAVFERIGLKNTALKLVTKSEIPLASGLGSSAACIVGGAMAANALSGGKLDRRELINLCAELDGHPDNVLPAITGGVTAACVTESGVEYVRAEVTGVTAAVATPDFGLPTAKSRAVLPEVYSRADCVYSLSRAVCAFGALSTGDIEKLRVVGDRLHQPYRIPLIQGYAETEAALKAAGAICCCVSGAGPSVLAFFKTSPAPFALPRGWTLRILNIDNNGADINF